MKTRILTIVLIFISSFYLAAQTDHTINISGFTFSPDDLTIELGDKVIFNGSATHPVLEVSFDTWNINGDTPLSGGFAFPSGVGEITFTEIGDHYYICENHVSSGMKGKITVVSTTTDINNYANSEIKFYPNPLNTNNLYISIPGKLSNNFVLNIYDINGRTKVVRVDLKHNDILNVDFTDLIPGVYIVQLRSNNELFTQKIVKK